MPLPVQIQRLSRGLIKRLGLQGNLLMTVVEDLLPVVTVLGGPEGAFVADEALRGAQTTIPADVANISRVGLSNLGTARLAIVERVHFFVSGATDVLLSVEAPASVANIAGRPRDTRLGVPAVVPTSEVRLFGDNPVAGLTGFSFDRWRMPAAGEREVHVPVVLAPNTMLTVSTSALNIELLVSMWWRDFVAAPQELTG